VGLGSDFAGVIGDLGIGCLCGVVAATLATGALLRGVLTGVAFMADQIDGTVYKEVCKAGIKVQKFILLMSVKCDIKIEISHLTYSRK
jgi:hypothetical protein